MKLVIGALAAVTLLVGVAASQPAEARCFWDGFAWQCFHRPHHYWRERHWGWDRGWDRPHFYGWDRY